MLSNNKMDYSGRLFNPNDYYKRKTWKGEKIKKYVKKKKRERHLTG
jgi:hypothetical protein